MKTLSLKLPEGLFLQIEQEIQEEGLSKSELFRIALKNYFSLKSKKKVMANSFGALAKDLCGIVKLPENLSNHKKHMEGYGE
jgi:metal-responsive CopG/Arc/MetJ family transcriptional regulator